MTDLADGRLNEEKDAIERGYRTRPTGESMHLDPATLSVELCEVGPRDGFQFESKPVPTDLKLSIIRRLADAGIPRIQVTSFVHPKRVPQMADAESIVRELADIVSTDLSALALNRRGVERAEKCGVRLIDLSIATNEQHSRDNANMTVAEGVAEAEEMIKLAAEASMQPQLGLQTVFGYANPGDTPLEFIIELATRFCALPIESLSLADTTGMANPLLVRNVIEAVGEVCGEVPLVLHLHDTRGLGLANVTAAIACGVTRFDTSVGGLGGCPFIPGATGNIATEDTVYLLESLGVSTGIDVHEVSSVARDLDGFLSRRLPGMVHRLPGF